MTIRMNEAYGGYQLVSSLYFYFITMFASMYTPIVYGGKLVRAWVIWL